jgi:hypothetical protein
VKLPGTFRAISEQLAAVGRIPVSFRWDSDGHLIELVTQALPAQAVAEGVAKPGQPRTIVKRTAVGSLYKDDTFVPAYE